MAAVQRQSRRRHMPRGSASTQQRLQIPSPIISAGVCAHCGYSKYLQAVPPTLQARVHAIVVLGIDREAVPVQRAADEPFTLAFGGAKGTDGSSWAMQGAPIAKVGQPHPAKHYVCCDLASLVCGATLALQCNLPCLLGQAPVQLQAYSIKERLQRRWADVQAQKPHVAADGEDPGMAADATSLCAACDCPAVEYIVKRSQRC